MTGLATSLLAGLEALDWVRAVRTSPVLYPLLNGTHILGLALLVGSIATVHVAALRDGTAAERVGHRPGLVLARCGFGLAAATGAVLFACRATHYAANPAFLAKLGLIALALGNVALFHRVAGPARPRLAMLSAATSLAAWTATIGLDDVDALADAVLDLVVHRSRTSALPDPVEESSEDERKVS